MPEGYSVIKAILVVGLWLVMASNAKADWHITQFTDRMTDHVFRYAYVPAKEPSSGVSAELHVGCFHAGLYVAVQLTREMPEGATISWRVDEQSVRYQPMPQVHSTSSSAIHELTPEILRRAKRVRLEWAASTGKVFVLRIRCYWRRKGHRSNPLRQRRLQVNTEAHRKRQATISGAKAR
jgi:hypothetical protein